jgi:hypothetical protein
MAFTSPRCGGYGMAEKQDRYEAPALTEFGTIEDRTRQLIELSIVIG